MDPSFDALLRRHRAAAGLSQAALASRSGISVHAISMLERGVRTRPRSSTVIRLARALRLTAPDREALAAASGRPPATSPGRAVPLELPRPPADFTGRAVELRALRHLLADGERRTVVAVIDGMGGAGKSALALHAAHGLADAGAFPDGQLYLNLHGSTAGLPPLTPLEGLLRMLRSLGAEAGGLPTGVEEAAARFRSLTARRRLLVLLDNARSAEQVRALLPGGPGCVVLVTSRHVLTTLEGARALHLDVLPRGRALELLRRIAGPERVAREAAAAAQVVRWCGRLPLAIRIAGARLASRPGWTVPELADQLADASRRLEELRAGELAVRATFDVSLRALSESADPADRAAAAAFGLLGLPDGPDIGVPAAARLLGETEPAARAMLERLVDARLLENPRPGRYQFHDLVRLCAREHAAAHHPAHVRRAALTRFVGFSVASAWRTLALLRPGIARLASADPRWTVGGQAFPDAEAALEWLEAERPNLMAAIAQSADADSSLAPELAGELARALFAFFEMRGHWHDWARANEAVLAAARRHGDRARQASALNDLGVASDRLGRYDRAIASLQESLAISRGLCDRGGQAARLSNLGPVYYKLGRHDEAVACLRESLDLGRELGDRTLQANSLINLGVAHRRLGRYAESVECLVEAVAVSRELGDARAEAAGLNSLGVVYGLLSRLDEAVASLLESLRIARSLGARPGEGDVLGDLGIVYSRLGRHDQAVDCLRQSVAMSRELGDPRVQALALQGLGDVLQAAGRGQDGRAAWLEALTIAETLRIPETDEIRARLAALRTA